MPWSVDFVYIPRSAIIVYTKTKKQFSAMCTYNDVDDSKIFEFKKRDILTGKTYQYTLAIANGFVIVHKVLLKEEKPM